MLKHSKQAKFDSVNSSVEKISIDLNI